MINTLANKATASTDLPNTPIVSSFSDVFKAPFLDIKPKWIDGLDDNLLVPLEAENYLSAAEFNEAMDDPKSIVVDMRNYYESEVGHFNDAICPDADTFKEILPLVKKILN